MKTAKRSVHVLALAISLTGCTLGQMAGHVVGRYCALPEPARTANREAVALATTPHRISIQCGEH